MTASLFKDLDGSSWHSSIMTTYSVDPAFYDGSIEHRLRTYGCENNILMADAVMLKRALNATPEAFKNGGRRYAIVPVHVAGCFHPKIHLRLGRDGGRLIVGSANATAAGWGINHEIITAIEWSRKSDDPWITALGPIIRRSYDYLAHWLEEVPGGSIDFKLRLHHRDSPWLDDLTANTKPITLPDGSALDIFCERGGDDKSMLPQILSLVDGEQALRLVVISPFWDANLNGLIELHDGLAGCSTIIALNPALNEFPIEALDHDIPVEFAAIHDGDEGHRFLHAKLILIQTDKADHLLFGSANCSNNAMGSAGNRARNAEVSIYRRFAPGEGFKLLGLDLSRTLDRSIIRPPEPNELLFQSGATAKPAGSVEVDDRLLTWWPPSGIDATGAKILIDDDALSTTPIGNEQYRSRLQTDPTYPLIVRVQFGDGIISDPLIVHDETALRIASPGVTDRRLRSAFNRVLQGEEDIIDLALQAHLIFEPSSDNDVQVGRATRTGTQYAEETETTDYSTPEEFREGVSLKPATGQSGRFSVDDPGLLDLLSIILRGVIDVGGREARRLQDAEEDADLQAGENEDGDEFDEPMTQEPKAEPPTPPDENQQKTYTPAQIERRRNQLKKAITAFEKMLKNMTEEQNFVSSSLTVQTAFILNLMLYACTKAHPKPEGPPVKLMEIAPRPSADRELTFAVRAGRILNIIWIGGRGGSLIEKLEIDRRHETLTDDFFYLIVMSRWAIARAYLATVNIQGKDSLGDILRTNAISIYRASAQYGPIDSEAEHLLIAKLDEVLGFSEAETSRLIKDCKQFSGMVNVSL